MSRAITGIVFRRGRMLLWGACLAAALVLPLVFKGGFVVSLLCQMGIMVVFALSYNMLLGQTGLLSFGHAVYYGLGAFVSMHVLNLFGKDGGPLAVALLALAGDAEVKARLVANTEEAVARGVFGAPTMFVGAQMFFGQDRLDFVAEVLRTT